MGSKDGSPPTKHISPHSQDEYTSPKKRRKVNHACIYCRRSHMTCDLERPCLRCVKRSIGHLCHDEPKEPAKPKGEYDRNIAVAANGTQAGTATFSQEPLENVFNASASSQPLLAGLTSNLDLGLSAGEATQAVTSSVPMTSSIPAQSQNLGAFSQPYSGQANWAFSNQNGAQDIHQMYGPYMFNAPDIGSEYNVLNDFLNTSLLDEGSLFSGDESQFPATDQALANSLAATSAGENLPVAQEPQAISADQAAATEAPAPPSRPKSARPPDREDERFYMNIADPSGNDQPEERMKKLLEAKYAAGILRPFNYVQGYARLNAYLEGHMKPASRQMMMRQIDKFRPKFREVMQSLTDMELTMVEMWVERSLMEYDRLFASLAIPACCWRRTGEIFRGNKEMAELIHVPVDKLRDGQLALHEIMSEDDLVNYWDNFLAIAFDKSQKAMLTSCTLKDQDPLAKKANIKCCFSFTIRRDAQHNIPFLIVGNFLPQIPRTV